MKIIVTKSYEESCRTVAEEIIKQVKENPSSKLGLATGGTAENVIRFWLTHTRKGKLISPESQRSIWMNTLEWTRQARRVTVSAWTAGFSIRLKLIKKKHTALQA